MPSQTDQTVDARTVMVQPLLPTDQRLTLSVGETSERYVPEAAYEALFDAYVALRRTVALAHTHLIFDGSRARENALTRIEQATGLTWEDARAMQGILLAVADGSLTSSQ